MNEKNASFSLERAKAAVLSRDFDLAKRIYNQILRASPDNVEVLNHLAGVYVKTGEDGAASLFFLKGLRLDPKNFIAMDNLGGIYRRLGRNEESLEILEEALKTGKNSILVNYNMGQTYKQMGRYTEAEDCFMAVIDDNPNDVLAYNHLGCIYQLKNEHKKAIQTFRRALEIDPNHPILHYNTALSYEVLEKNDEAAKSYENALRSRPGWAEVMASYADLLARTKKFDNAELILDQAKKFGISDAKIHNLQARLYYAKNDLSSAEAEYRKAIEANPKDVSSLSQLGNLLERQNKGSAALKFYEKLEILEPSNLDTKQQIVKLLMRNNEAEKAEGRLQKLEKANPEDINTLSLQGQWHTLMGDEKSAKACFESISKIEPGNVLYRKELADTLSSVNKFEEAEINLRRYLSEKADDPDAWLKLGKIYETLNDIKKALTVYRKLLTLDPLNHKLEEAVSGLCKKTNGDPDAICLMSDILDARSKNAENGNDLERMLASYEQLAALAARSVKKDENLKKAAADSEEQNSKPQEDETSEQAEEEPQNLHAPTIDEEISQLDLELHTDEEEENELNFSSIQENLDDYMDEIGKINNDPLVAQDAPLDPDTLAEEISVEFGEAKNTETLEEEEILDLGGHEQGGLPDEIEDRQEIEEVDDRRPPDPPSAPPPPMPQYPNYPQYPTYPPMPPPARPAPKFDEKPAAENKKIPPENPPIDEEIPPEEEPIMEEEIPFEDDPVLEEEQEEILADDEPIMEEVEENILPDEEELPEEDESDEGDESDEEEIPPEEPPCEDDKKTENVEKIHEALNKIRETEAPVEAVSTLEMFEYIRGLCDYLPPIKKEAFAGSENRMYLEYIINKMKNKPGLMTEAKVVEQIVPHEEPVCEIIPAEKPITSDSIGSAFGYLRSLSFEIPDKKLASALDTSVSKLLSRWKDGK